MDDKQRRSEQLKSVEAIFWTAMLLFGGIWLSTLADQYFQLHWGLAWSGIWMGPLVMLGGIALRFIVRAIYRFVDQNY